MVELDENVKLLNPKSDGTDSRTLELTCTVTGVPRTFFAPAAFTSPLQVATTP